ncbi:MAG: DUF4199 domain-containing protein [Bacteroidia bacterium]
MNDSLKIKLGITAGIINCIAWYFISKSLTYYEVATIDKYRAIITMALLVLGIVLVILFQRKGNRGFLEFKQAFKSGVLYTLFLALILAIFSYLYYKYIAPDAIAFYLSEAKKQVTETIKPEDVLNFEKNVKDFFSPFKMFMSTIIFGIIISLLVAAIFQKKNPTMPFSEN